MGSDCILAKNKPKKDGYVQERVGGVKRYSHVVAWEKVNGPVPEGFELDHLCFVKNCINVDHLEVVTHQVNCLRRKSRITCFKGHEFNEENTIVKQHQRSCRKCSNKKQRERRAA